MKNSKSLKFSYEEIISIIKLLDEMKDNCNDLDAMITDLYSLFNYNSSIDNAHKKVYNLSLVIDNIKFNFFLFQLCLIYNVELTFNRNDFSDEIFKLFVNLSVAKQNKPTNRSHGTKKQISDSYKRYIGSLEKMVKDKIKLNKQLVDFEKFDSSEIESIIIYKVRKGAPEEIKIQNQFVNNILFAEGIKLFINSKHACEHELEDEKENGEIIKIKRITTVLSHFLNTKTKLSSEKFLSMHLCFIHDYLVYLYFMPYSELHSTNNEKAAFMRYYRNYYFPIFMD